MRDSAATPLSQLLHEAAPAYLSELPRHGALCAQSAARVVPDDQELQKVVANLYQKFADGLMAVTALEYLTERGALPDPRAVVDVPLDAVLLDRVEAAAPGVTRALPPTAEGKLLATPALRRRMIAKYLMHLAFRFAGGLAGPRRLRSRTVVRSWVDVTRELYPDLSRDHLLLIYPFSIRIMRQVRYLRALWREGMRFRLVGYPYRLSGLVRWLRSGQDRDLGAWESAAARDHATWVLERCRPESVLTSDEFEPASVVMHSTFRRHGAVVENTAHGVGRYSMFVDYDAFHVLTDSQVEYYRRFNGSLQLIRPPDEEKVEGPRATVRTVVFVDQVQVDDGSSVQLLQRRVIDVLIDFCRDSGLELVIKQHPNTRIRTPYRRDEARYFSGPADELDSPLFLTVYSTAYLSFQHLGPTYLVGDDRFDARDVFGPSARILQLDALESELSDLCA